MPMPPPAPGLFSMMMGALRTRLIASATGRATISATPPGGNGTTIAIGFDGYASCACAGTAGSIASDRTTSAILPERVMLFVPLQAWPGSDEDPVKESAQDQPLRDVVRKLALALECLGRQPDVIGDAENLVEHADVVARHVLGLARADDRRLVPVIDRGHDAAGQRPLDVAEQD